MATLNGLANKYDTDVHIISEMLSARGIPVPPFDERLDPETESLLRALLENERRLLDEGTKAGAASELKPYEPPFDYSVDKRNARFLKGCYITVIGTILLILAAFFALGEMLSSTL